MLETGPAFLLMLDYWIVVLPLFPWILASSFCLKMVNSFLMLKLIEDWESTISYHYTFGHMLCCSKAMQYSSTPQVPHLKSAHKVLHYFKGTIGQAIFYPVDDDFQVKALCDSDWLQCPDSQRSISGFCIFFGDSLVS